jgi:hypothetical protein
MESKHKEHLNESFDEDHPLMYKEDPYEEDMFQEDMDWKKQQERVVRFQSNLVPKLIVQPARIKVKRFKQKMR